jgi:hypothetical protein
MACEDANTALFTLYEYEYEVQQTSVILESASRLSNN